MKRGAAALLPALAVFGCRDVSSFTTSPNDRYEGVVVDADFVRSGIAAGTSLCLTLDADHLQDAPGLISTRDGRFHLAPLRSIPQIWNDPLSTLSFGEGRLKNLVYVVSATTPFGDNEGDDVLAVVSLMQSGGVEVRLVRGAPPVGGDAGATGAPTNVFGVFQLAREKGPCSY
ncbi:MAG: hypothetical protein FWD17_17285 [Polyangiaceae bacterium]|nr:hypothetical protein [Polyangiaceae bacterium]